MAETVKAAKKSATKRREASTENATKKRAAKKATTVGKPTKTRAARQREKLEQEREQYLRKISGNEARLAAGLAVDGTPLTSTQIETTRDILARQRQHLDAIDALTSDVEEMPSADPR